MTADDRGSRHLLRHAVATLADRGGKVVRDIPENFETLRVSPTSRTPSQILAHVGDLLDWALWMARGQRRWRDSEPLPWDLEVARFFGALERLDTVLGLEAALGCSAEQLFQAPIADAFTPVGQLAMLRRVAGSPVRGENFAKADIRTGSVGPTQTAARVEFD